MRITGRAGLEMAPASFKQGVHGGTSCVRSFSRTWLERFDGIHLAREVGRRMWLVFDFRSKLKRLEHGTTYDSSVLLGQSFAR